MFFALGTWPALPRLTTVASARTTARCRIPTNAGYQILDTVVVGCSDNGSRTVAGAVATGAANVFAFVLFVLAGGWWNGMATAAGRRWSRRGRCQRRYDCLHLGHSQARQVTHATYIGRNGALQARNGGSLLG